MILRKPFLALLGALLILVQSVFAAEVAIPADDTNDYPYQAEIIVKQEVSSQTNYVEMNGRLSFTTATFLVFWISKLFNFPQADFISYKNYKAFFGNAYIFNAYYTYTSALAP